MLTKTGYPRPGWETGNGKRETKAETRRERRRRRKSPRGLFDPAGSRFFRRGSALHVLTDVLDRFADLPPGPAEPFLELAARAFVRAFALEIGVSGERARRLFDSTFDVLDASFHLIAVLHADAPFPRRFRKLQVPCRGPGRPRSVRFPPAARPRAPPPNGCGCRAGDSGSRSPASRALPRSRS